MSFRFRKSVRIAPGVRLNFSRSGISTTVGMRGLSVNVGRRGTYLNAGLPGTGLSSRTRIGGGRLAAVPPSGAAAAGASGCAGCGFVLVMLLFVGFCSALVTPPNHAPTPSLDTGRTYDGGASSADPTETLYAHQPINVRSGPASGYARVRTLARGDQASVGAADASGWAPVYDWAGTREGYVFRASGRLRADPPASRHRSHTRTQESRPSGASAVCRDGTYSYSAHRRGTCSHHGGVSSWL
jgi:hypothetical protein